MRWSLLLLAGCIPEPSGSVEVRGRHITVHAAPTIPVCAPALAAADRYVEDVAAMLGVEPPSIDYYLIDGDTGCGYGQYTGSSCTLGNTVYANAWIHFHELAHAVDDSHPPALFGEGFAEAMSKPSRIARQLELSRVDARLDFDSPTFRAAVPWKEYQVAADFMRFVIDRFGAERYRSFARSVVSLTDSVSMRRAFSRAFGVSLDSVIAAWRATTPADSPVTVPVDHADCQDPIPPAAPDTWRVDHIEPDGCESGSTTGASFKQPSGRYGFEVTTPGLYLLEVATDRGDQTGVLRSCAPDAAYDYAASGSTRRFTAVQLNDGRHAVDVVEGTRAWAVSRVGAVGESCETAPTFSAPVGEAWQLDIRGGPASWIRITNASRPLYGTANGTSATRACWGPCSNLECISIAYGADIRDTHGQPLYIVLGQTALPDHAVSVRTDDSVTAR